MTFVSKVFFSLSAIKSIENSTKFREKSEGNSRIFLKKTRKWRKGAILENILFAKSSPSSDITLQIHGLTLAT